MIVHEIKRVIYEVKRDDLWISTESFSLIPSKPQVPFLAHKLFLMLFDFINSSFLS